jgi:hypothetical protein
VDTEIVVSLITAAIALLSAFVSVVLSSRAARTTAKFQHELELHRSRASKEQLVAELMARYREPLLKAAFDLQSRIYNIVGQAFLVDFFVRGSTAEQEYALRNTLFVFAEYLGWAEILRRDVQFLDLGDVERNRQLVDRLDVVSEILADSRTIKDPAFRLFKGQQRALGEVMIEPAENSSSRDRCIGYAGFVTRLETEPAFARWFEQLAEDVQRSPEDPEAHVERLVPLQHALIDLINFLDDPPVRFSVEQPMKLAR